MDYVYVLFIAVTRDPRTRDLGGALRRFNPNGRASPCQTRGSAAYASWPSPDGLSDLRPDGLHRLRLSASPTTTRFDDFGRTGNGLGNTRLLTLGANDRVHLVQLISPARALCP